MERIRLYNGMCFLITHMPTHALAHQNICCHYWERDQEFITSSLCFSAFKKVSTMELHFEENLSHPTEMVFYIVFHI